MDSKIEVGSIWGLEDGIAQPQYVGTKVKVVSISYIEEFNKRLITFMEIEEKEEDTWIDADWEDVFLNDFFKLD
ncbi:TPA: hypothetical protein ACSRER_001435 [Clostridioides difficile]|uniref:hypothetical protein n=1 Tax=Clostridioides difficile TaxID=1496 RepID=UPI0010280993|nr:hypothetical protein [Clostridioides difficile]MCW0695480.1 hypothetical protein [Clostridioides difficile]MDV9989527.1 hypothetical protein [Clostridioides difficile]VFB72122.1 Uncharacterised protein [Clostridioides difficile]HBE9518605.1 hypothetical protein [Clostridioides difficile]HBF5466420.1 hypothetical protein [Clostridioides difficile]